jgi:chromosome segregation ATPase
MNRAITILNTVGVLALATLCVFQWQTNRRVNLEASSLEKTRQEQAVKIAEQEKSLKGLAADLETFREQILRANAASQESDSKLLDLELAVRHLTAERDALKTNMEKWSAAVAERDETVKKANEQIKALAEERNTAIQKYNELAARFETAVKEINQWRAKYGKAPQLEPTNQPPPPP